MAQLLKRDGESDYDYHARLVRGKLVDKTLADIDYTELSEYVYGQGYSSDVARRMLYGSKRTLDIVESEMLSRVSKCNPDIIGELDAKRIELQKERQRFSDQRREYNKLVNADARAEHLYSALIESANNLYDTVGQFYNDTAYHEYGVSVTDNEAVLVLSDWHYGMKASNAFNEYNTDICKERVRWMAIGAAARIRSNLCKKLHIVILGDLYHGACHVSARVASEELVCDQLMQVSEILAQTIEYLAQFVPSTHVYMTYGNHARTVANKKESIHRDNMERIVPWWLEARLAGHDNICVEQDLGNEFILINTCGHNIVATHGDNDTVRSAPRVLTALFQKKYGKDIEYVLLGDKHHRESFDELGCTALLCGSLCGADDYANSKRLYSDPSQLLLITNEACGVDAEYRIKC